MSHGNITVATGRCEVCGREDVELHEYRDSAGETRRACTDEFACLAEYARGLIRSPHSRRWIRSK